MRPFLNRISPFLPWLGLLLLLAGAIVTVVTRRFELVNNLLLAGGALLLLLYALLQPNEVRRLVSGRRARYGSSTLLSVLFFVAIAAILYYIAYQNPDWRYDATETDQFTPPAETVELLEEADEPIHVIGFYTVDQVAQQDEAERLLETLQSYNSELTYEFQDLEVNPALAQRYELNFPGTLVFTRDVAGEEVFSKANNLAERDIHAALVQVINPVEKKLYYVTGHGEPGIDAFEPTGLATTVGLLEDSGFTVRPINLNISPTIPADASAIAVVAPQVPLQEVEVEAIADYMEGGGAALFVQDVTDYQTARPDEGLAELLADWGLDFRQDIIIEERFAQAGSMLATDFLGANYGASPITNELGEFGTVFNVARSIGDQAVEGLQQVRLVETSPNSWGETDFAALAEGLVNPDEADAQGPLAVGVSVENLDSGARIIALSDADFFNNQGILQLGNSLLFTNALNWLAGDEVSIELTPRESIQRQLVIPQEQLRLIQLAGLCLGPALMGLLGVFIWYSRRNRV